MSQQHPSFRRVHRDIERRILYDSDGKTKQFIALLVFTQTKRRLFELWKTKQKDTILVHLGKETVSFPSFCKYIPSHCIHQEYLTLMACDDCVLYKYLKEAVDRTLKSNHVCSAQNCSVCTLLQHDSFVLLEYMCCSPVSDYYLDQYCTLPALHCASGYCDECKYTEYDRVLNCEEIKCPDYTTFTYKRLETKRGQSKAGKTTLSKVPVSDNMDWGSMKSAFSKMLRSFLTHLYKFKMQFYARRYIFTHLRAGQLAVSCDYIESIPIIGPYLFNSRKAKELQLFVIYEADIDNGQYGMNDNDDEDRMAKTVYFFISDQDKKGAASSKVHIEKYIERKKREYPWFHNGCQLETVFIFSDSSTSDNWGADFHGHSIEITKKHQVQLISNRLPGGHNKWLHDTFGNYAKAAATRAMRAEDIIFESGQSPSDALFNYLNENHRISQTGTQVKKFHFINVPAEELPARFSDIETLKANGEGVTKFHSIRADPDGTLWFKYFSCFCQQAQDAKFRVDCNHSDRCGDWKKVDRIRRKSDIPRQRREPFKYTETAKTKELFGDKELNKQTLSELRPLCSKYNLSTKGKKNDIIERLVGYAMVRENMDFRIPASHAKYPVWRYCSTVSLGIKRRLLALLSCKERVPSGHREDIFLDTVKEGAVHKRMIFRINNGVFRIASERVDVSNTNKRRRLNSCL